MPIKCQCGHENPDSAFHCENCGERIAVQQEDYSYQKAAPQNAYQQTEYTQQPYYQQPYYQQPANQGEQPVSVGTWVGLLLLFSIPFVNIIALIILCASQRKSLRNYAIAQLIIMGAVFVLTILFVVGLGWSVSELVDQYSVMFGV